MEPEIEKIIGRLEDRVTVLEVVSKYREPKKKKRDLLKLLDDNAEIIAGIALFIALNIIVWEYVNAS